MQDRSTRFNDDQQQHWLVQNKKKHTVNKKNPNKQPLTKTTNNVQQNQIKQNRHAKINNNNNQIKPIPIINIENNNQITNTPTNKSNNNNSNQTNKSNNNQNNSNQQTKSNQVSTYKSNVNHKKIKGYAIFNNTLVEYLYDTGADTSIIQQCLYEKILIEDQQTKLMEYNGNLRSVTTEIKTIGKTNLTLERRCDVKNDIIFT